MSRIVFEHIVNEQGIIQAEYHDDVHEGKIRFEMADPIEVREDLVAEALSTLCGQYYDRIEMRLKVSEKTKQSIEHRTHATLVCQKGIKIWQLHNIMGHDVKTLNFSGDLSNLSAMALTPGDMDKVSLDFGSESMHQYDMFDHMDSKLIKTNILDTHFPKITSDYYAIGAIFYKDYFNTHYLVTGLQLNPKTMSMTRIEAEQRIAGMVNLPHTLGLTAVGHTHIACQRYPNYVNDAIKSVKTSESFLNVQQQLLVEIENETYRLGLPLKNRALHPTKIKWGTNIRLDFYALYILKQVGRSVAEYLVEGIPVEAEQLVQDYRLAFYKRYYPGVLYYLPKSVQLFVRTQLKDYGIPMYTNEDFEEFRMVEQWLRRKHTNV
ncbi:hypothetical protein [Staphylococcus canis]|uniref:Uncharacterized protein n=1 Tax=Staphylococcus canis TaxID=2724942 RepID=A0ABS0TD95_9STAP|nr:hypothetical protein [Staphylococcus canis]MBI5975936.1 hypothetical protein [Staphylococcus canis]